jgi:hypothetical protein
VVTAKTRRGASFPQEATSNVGVLDEGWKQHLDGDGLLEVQVGSGQDGSHSPEPDHALDFVLASDDVPGFGDSFERVWLIMGWLFLHGASPS